MYMTDFLIEAKSKREYFDAIGSGTKQAIIEDLGIKGIESVGFAEAYKISGNFSAAEIEKIAKELVADRIVQEYSINGPVFQDVDWEITVWFHPDVTDNVAIAAIEGIEDLLGRKFGENEKVRSARQYGIKGKVAREDVEKICKNLLANELIETVEIKGRD